MLPDLDGVRLVAGPLPVRSTSGLMASGPCSLEAEDWAMGGSSEVFGRRSDASRRVCDLSGSRKLCAKGPRYGAHLYGTLRGARIAPRPPSGGAWIAWRDRLVSGGVSIVHCASESRGRSKRVHRAARD